MYHHLFSLGLLSTMLLTVTASPVSFSPATSKDVLNELEAQGIAQWNYTDIGHRYTTFAPGVYQAIEDKLNSHKRSLNPSTSPSVDLDARDANGLTYKVNCYNSGVWAAQSLLYSFYTQACSTFSGSSAQKGSVLVYVATAQKGDTALDLVYRKTVLSDSNMANIMQYCYLAYDYLVNSSNCKGDNSDTQGGTLTYNNMGEDIASFVADPNVA
jgi:hypothetical protein